MIDGILPRLYERDIDVLLQEELIFNKALNRMLIDRLKLEDSMRVHRCDLSVVDHTGETDLFATFSIGARRGAILIENKIDASFQKDIRNVPSRLPQETDLIACSAFSSRRADMLKLNQRNFRTSMQSYRTKTLRPRSAAKRHRDRYIALHCCCGQWSKREAHMFLSQTPTSALCGNASIRLRVRNLQTCK
jgi:hypothetical protein